MEIRHSGFLLVQPSQLPRPDRLGCKCSAAVEQEIWIELLRKGFVLASGICCRLMSHPFHLVLWEGFRFWSPLDISLWSDASGGLQSSAKGSHVGIPCFCNSASGGQTLCRSMQVDQKACAYE